MLRSKIVSVVNICASHGWTIVAIAAILSVLCAYYSVIHFSIDTNVNKLISRDLDWRKNELELNRAFPYRNETIVAVVEAPTSELASQATAELVEHLSTRTSVFTSVRKAADPGPGDRPELAGTGAGPHARFGRRPAQHVHARRDGESAHHVREHHRGCDRGSPGELLVARAGSRQATGR